jgi:hypothetical protein
VDNGRVDERSPEDPVAVLRRWEAAGAGWRVVSEGPEGLTVALLTCTGGEEVSRFTSAAPALMAYVYDA